jgi:hypothetical protein
LKKSIKRETFDGFFLEKRKKLLKKTPGAESQKKELILVFLLCFSLYLMLYYIFNQIMCFFKAFLENVKRVVLFIEARARTETRIGCLV